MKMNDELLNMMNMQLNREFYASYLYFAMAIYFKEINMDGFAKLAKDHAAEELEHARKIYDYLILRDEKISLLKIEAPKNEWINPKEAVAGALNHEKFISEEINKIYNKAKELKDSALEIFLHWFVAEQVEEEHLFRSMLDKIEYVKDCNCEIMNINRELGSRKE